MSDLLKIKEVASTLRVGTPTVKRWIKLGSLEAVELPRIGKQLHYRVTQEAINTISSEEGDLLTTREAAKMLRVDITTVKHWIAQGIMEGIALPTAGKRQHHRVRRATVNKILNNVLIAGE